MNFWPERRGEPGSRGRESDRSIRLQARGAVEEHGLISEVEAARCVSSEEQEALGYLLRSIKQSPENINDLIISAVSVLAIVIDLTLL